MLELTTTNLSLGVGFIGSSVFILACLSITRKRTLWFLLAATTIYVISYLIKGDWLGAGFNFFSTARTALFIIEDRMTAITGQKLLTKNRIVTLTIVGIVAVWTFTLLTTPFQWYQLLLLFAPVVMVIALANTNVTKLKSLAIINGVLWLGYQFFSGAYTLMIGEAVGVIANSVAAYRTKHSTSKS